MSWWQNLPWREKQKLPVVYQNGTSGQKDKLFRHHNPSCTHELTSYDVMHCEACAKFTETILEGNNAQDADATPE